MVFTYTDGSKLEFTFADLSDVQLRNYSYNQAYGMENETWMRPIRDRLLAHGPISAIADISCSVWFYAIGKKMFWNN